MDWFRKFDRVAAVKETISIRGKSKGLIFTEQQRVDPSSNIVTTQHNFWLKTNASNIVSPTPTVPSGGSGTYQGGGGHGHYVPAP